MGLAALCPILDAVGCCHDNDTICTSWQLQLKLGNSSGQRHHLNGSWDKHVGPAILSFVESLSFSQRLKNNLLFILGALRSQNQGVYVYVDELGVRVCRKA